MFLGVPYIPFFVGAGGCLLIAMYTNLIVLVALAPLMFVLRQMARRDELVFRLIGLRLRIRIRVRNLSLHRGAWAFTPNAVRENGPGRPARRTASR